MIDQARKHLIDFEIAINPNYRPANCHEVIARELELIEQFGDRDYKVLLVFMPPRHGKSELCSIGFPAWYLGRNSDKEIITISYSAELAQDFGEKTRSIISGDIYPHIFNIKLKEDEQAKAKWRTNKGGSYTSVGVGGAITGRGANCFPAGTLVTTDTGSTPIEACKYGTRVLSYNHDRNTVEWRPITRTLRRRKKGFTTITTSSGSSVKSTKDHPIFIFGKGYIEAENVRKGERVRILTTRTESHTRLFSLRKGVPTSLVRIHQSNSTWVQRLLLLSRMFSEASFDKEQQTLYLWKHCIAWAQILFKKVCTRQKSVQENILSFLQEIFYGSRLEYASILLNGMQKRPPFPRDVGKQPKLQTRYGNGEVSTRVSKEEVRGEEESKSGMSNLQDETSTHIASPRYEPSKQRGYKSGNSVSGMSYGSSQIEQDAVSSITSTDEELDVYDIEVEDNHNFFANGILVHNCLLFDDPIKNREEAESEVYREKVWQFFTSTAFTRLEPKGVVVVILTRWHLDDLASRIMSNPQLKRRMKIIHFEAIDKQGKPLWPERYPLPVLEEIKNTIGPYDWQALYQGNPVLSENQEFKPQWIKHISEAELNSQTIRRFLTVDTAMSKATYADYTGFCDNSVNRENFWNLRAWRSKIGPEELVDSLFNLYTQNHYEAVGIEKTAYLHGLKPYLDSEQRRRNKYLPIVELSHNQQQKQIRIRGLIPRYAANSIYHVDNQCKPLEEEMFSFPVGVHDDVLDACLVGETVVLCERGNIPIKDVKVGDRVMTRQGYKKVLVSMQTGVKEVVENVGMTGTYNHPVITTGGFKDLRYVGVSDILHIWNSSKQRIERLSFMEAKNIIDTQTQKNTILGRIMSGIAHGMNLRFRFIDKFGLITLARYLKDFISTTKKAVYSIMRSPILAVSQHQITQHTTESNQSDWLIKEDWRQLEGNMQKCGTEARRENNGIKNMLSRLLTGLKENLDVLNVKNFIRQQLKELHNIAQKDVVIDGRQESLDTKTLITTKLRMVYNLEVEEAHEYFANNILVHNCAYQLQIADNPNVIIQGQSSIYVPDD